MKKVILSVAVLTAVLISGCGNKVDTKMCEEHVKNCPKSENCPEHPDCEAHEQCTDGANCTKHPNCAAFDKKNS